MQTPAYEEVIERYGLEILKVPGDLVVKDGNIAVSRGRNLMLQSEEYSALVQLVHGWRYNGVEGPSARKCTLEYWTQC
jgi:hypothetical protein